VGDESWVPHGSSAGFIFLIDQDSGIDDSTGVDARKFFIEHCRLQGQNPCPSMPEVRERNRASLFHYIVAALTTSNSIEVAKCISHKQT